MGKNIDCNNNDFEIKGIKLVKYHGKNKNVLVPKEVRFVLKGAFENCDFIEYITFQSNLYQIEKKAFAGCTNLKSIILPDEVDFMEEGAFSGCSSLEKIIIPKGIYTIFPDTFQNCQRLKKITLPDTIAYFGTFSDNMEKMTIIAHKGTFAEEYAKKSGCMYMPLEERGENGFYPFFTEGRPVVFYNFDKGIKKLIIDKSAFVDFPGFQYPEVIMKYYRAENLPNKIRFRVEFVKKESGYIVIWNIQPDGWYYFGDSSEGEHVELYASLNDLGEFTSKFHLYKVGVRKYENTDLEEQENDEILKRKN